MVTPVAINTIGWQYYIVFAVISACIPVSVYFLFPETKGRSLEELDLIFRESPSPWATVRFTKNRPPTLPQDSTGDKLDVKSTHFEEGDAA